MHAARRLCAGRPIRQPAAPCRAHAHDRRRRPRSILSAPRGHALSPAISRRGSRSTWFPSTAIRVRSATLPRTELRAHSACARSARWPSIWGSTWKRSLENMWPATRPTASASCNSATRIRTFICFCCPPPPRKRHLQIGHFQQWLEPGRPQSVNRRIVFGSDAGPDDPLVFEAGDQHPQPGNVRRLCSEVQLPARASEDRRLPCELLERCDERAPLTQKLVVIERKTGHFKAGARIWFASADDSKQAPAERRLARGHVCHFNQGVRRPDNEVIAASGAKFSQRIRPRHRHCPKSSRGPQRPIRRARGCSGGRANSVRPPT